MPELKQVDESLKASIKEFASLKGKLSEVEAVAKDLKAKLEEAGQKIDPIPDKVFAETKEMIIELDGLVYNFKAFSRPSTSMKKAYEFVLSKVNGAIKDMAKKLEEEITSYSRVRTIKILPAGEKNADIKTWWNSLWNKIVSAVKPLLSVLRNAIDSLKKANDLEKTRSAEFIDMGCIDEALSLLRRRPTSDVFEEAKYLVNVANEKLSSFVPWDSWPLAYAVLKSIKLGEMIKMAPAWVADHDLWNSAKKQVERKPGWPDSKYWGIVSLVYKNMGGKVRKQSEQLDVPVMVLYEETPVKVVEAKESMYIVNDGVETFEVPKSEVTLITGENLFGDPASISQKFKNEAMVVDLEGNTGTVVGYEGDFCKVLSDSGVKMVRESDLEDVESAELNSSVISNIVDGLRELLVENPMSVHLSKEVTAILEGSHFQLKQADKEKAFRYIKRLLKGDNAAKEEKIVTSSRKDDVYMRHLASALNTGKIVLAISSKYLSLLELESDLESKIKEAFQERDASFVDGLLLASKVVAAIKWDSWNEMKLDGKLFND